jgi:hypothetical protein
MNQELVSASYPASKQGMESPIVLGVKGAGADCIAMLEVCVYLYKTIKPIYNMRKETKWSNGIQWGDWYIKFNVQRQWTCAPLAQLSRISAISNRWH